MAAIENMQKLFEAITAVLMRYQQDCPEMPPSDVLCTLGNVVGFIIAQAPEQDRQQAIDYIANSVEQSVPNFVAFLYSDELHKKNGGTTNANHARS